MSTLSWLESQVAWENLPSPTSYGHCDCGRRRGSKHTPLMTEQSSQ